MRLLWAVIGCLMGLVVASTAWAVEIDIPYFRSVAGTESIANGIATVVVQDQSGLIWIGTPDGLVRYDGYRFENLRHDPEDPGSLSHDFVRNLLPLDDGRLAVATQGGGLSVLDPSSGRFETHRHDPADPNSVLSDALLVLERQPGGGVWIGTALGGLNYWQPGEPEFAHHPIPETLVGEEDSTLIRSLLVDRRGDLWVGTRHGLMRRDAETGQFERVASEPGVPGSLHGQYVYSLYEAADGRIWVGTQGHGAVWLDPHTLALQRLPLDPMAGGVGHPWIGGFAEPRAGELWIFTFGAGIDILDLESMVIRERLRHDPAMSGSLAMDRVIQPMIDRSGLLWVGTWGGGLQLYNPRAGAFRALRHSSLRADGPTEPVLLSALEVDTQTIWLGTGGKGIDILDRTRGVIGGYRAEPGQADALQDGTVRALAKTPDGSLWVGTYQAGLHRYMGEGRFQHYPELLPDQRVRRLSVTADGDLLIGTESGLGILDPVTETLVMAQLNDGRTIDAPVWAVVEDRSGHLWVATPGELLLSRSDHDAFHPLVPERVAARAQPPGVVPRGVVDLLSTTDGTLWLIGSGGLMRLAGWRDDLPEFRSYHPEGAATARAYGTSLVEDDVGRLWTAGQMIDPVAGRLYEFGRADGVDVGNFELGAAARTADGNLLFAGTRGLLVIDPAAFEPWDYAPPLVATRLEIDGVAQPLERLSPELVLGASERRFNIEFAALDYSDPETLRYRYRLQGLDEDWIRTQSGFRVASYNNLWPRHYQLQVGGSNRVGQWSPHQLVVPVRVLPAWWQTTWFLAGLLLLTAACLYGGYWVRVRQMRQRARELALQVRQRTAELQSAKDRAERALEDLQEAQQQLVAAEKMASMGQLVAGVAHEINTPIGVAVTAASHLRSQMRTYDAKLQSDRIDPDRVQALTDMVSKASGMIERSLERAGTLIRSFRQLAVDQTSQQRRQIELGEFLNDKVLRALQPLLNKTAHSLVIDCPAEIVVQTSPGALHQVFVSLVENSLMHAFEAQQAGRMTLAVEAGDDRVLLDFRDDGIGMSEEVCRQAFDPFFTTRRGQGRSGLGLHLVHNLVTQVLEGSIELHSQPGKGTRVLIRLPVRSADQSSSSDRS
jgi:signal transduction histidine kinase/ligand-binding sensor domain-containing protein